MIGLAIDRCKEVSTRKCMVTREEASPSPRQPIRRHGLPQTGLKMRCYQCRYTERKGRRTGRGDEDERDLSILVLADTEG